MINLDPYVVDFIAGNWLVLSLFLGVLKIVASMTSWVGDDKGVYITEWCVKHG